MYHNLQFDAITDNLGFLLQGFGMSLVLMAAGLIGGFLAGCLVAAVRHFRVPVISQIAVVYVSFFRSMPFILILFWIYFTLPLITGRQIGAFESAIIAFIIFETAYFSEIIRAGIGAIPQGQLSAASALGMTTWQAQRYVILPQAVQKMLPALVTQSVILLQDTSLVYVVGLRDFLVNADIVASRENAIVEVYLFVALVYLVVCFAGSMFASRLKRRMA
ncbi:amino acid ABC transporter permease [Sagittula sp. NFXS13]|uniref:amino acid ABC transporter permease n=1 Tax=Sagittula sp. NFXS13 TaxID=2819095 RepID=UPI0032E02F25